MKSHWPLSILLLAVAASVLTSCSSGGVSALHSLSATLVDLNVDEAAPPDQRGIMTVRYLNESVLAIGLSSAEHRLFLNGNLVGRAVNKQPMGLPSSGSAVHEIRFPLARNLPAPGQVSYRLETVVTVIAGSETLRNRSQSEGVIELRDHARNP